MNRKKGFSQSGFSLLEAAFVLGIMGVIAGFSLPPMVAWMHRMRIKETHKNQEAVMKALASHALIHGFLPCPSPTPEGGESPVNCRGMGQTRGYVPFRTLGISGEFSLDGFRQPLTYIIQQGGQQGGATAEIDMLDNIYGIDNDFGYTRNSAQTVSPWKLFCSQRTRGTPLMIRDQYGKPAFVEGESRLGGDYEDFIAVILLSTGDARGLLTSGEQQNANMDFEFVDRPYSGSKGNLHRHILKWASRDFLAAHYGQASCAAIRMKFD